MAKFLSTILTGAGGSALFSFAYDSFTSNGSSNIVLISLGSFLLFSVAGYWFTSKAVEEFEKSTHNIFSRINAKNVSFNLKNVRIESESENRRIFSDIHAKKDVDIKIDDFRA